MGAPNVTGKNVTGMKLIAGLVVLGVLAACGDREIILPGQREDLDAIFTDKAPEQAPAPKASAIRIPAATNNANWVQGSGTPATRTAHPALSGAPALVWSANIGAGDNRKARITANPVVASGRIFTLDSGAKVTATATNGATIWQRDLTPSRDRAGDATGGGIATANGLVFVSSGFGVLTALNAETGAVQWEQELGGTGSGAPTVVGDLVYLTSGDDSGWAVEAASGKVRWQMAGTPNVTNVLGAPAPAITDKFAIFAFGDGEIQAAFRNGGLQMWSSQVSGQRRFNAAAKVADITGEPVISGNTVYIGTHSGRLVALDTGNGDRIWTANMGAIGAVWPVDNALFLVSDDNKVVRLDAQTGAEVWSVDLPGFTTDRPRKQKRTYQNLGPVLAGGKLYVASGDGLLRAFDPASGALIYSTEIPGGATTAPVVAGGTLYVVGSRGQLYAFR